MRLTGKKVVVTGGSQGLGGAIVSAFLDAGAEIVFCARNTDDIQKKLADENARLGGKASIHGLACDVADEASVVGFIKKSVELMGDIDVLINNAGIYGPIGLSEEVSFPEWARAMEVNLYGVFHTSRQVIPLFKKKKGGKIINVSGGGATNPLPRFSAYAASKAAVVRLTETFAEELKEFSIDVNAIAPGALKTRLMNEVMQAGKEKAGASFYAKNEKWMEDGGTPLELGAGLCIYLASEAGDGITGKLISAQWDPWQELDQHRDDLRNTDIYCLRRITPRDRRREWGQEERK